MAKLELLNNFPEPLTDKFELDPGVPGGRGVVVHPAPVLATVPSYDWLNVEVGLAAVGALLIEDVAPVAKSSVILPVFPTLSLASQIKTKGKKTIRKSSHQDSGNTFRTFLWKMIYDIEPSVAFTTQ